MLFSCEHAIISHTVWRTQQAVNIHCICYSINAEMVGEWIRKNVISILVWGDGAPFVLLQKNNCHLLKLTMCATVFGWSIFSLRKQYLLTGYHSH